MCVKGLNNIGKISMGVGIGADIIGCGLIMAGAMIGGMQGWHALAIGLIVSGGTIFIPGVIGGKIVLERARYLQAKEQKNLERVSQQYRKNITNL